MKQEFKAAAGQTYRAFSGLYLKVFEERNALVSFLLHGLFNSVEERENAPVDPMGGLTTQDFRDFIEYFLDHNYTFVSPEQILAGLEPGAKYALLTFDDGYFNNSLAVPVLREFKVPAVFFISTRHVLESKSFWWDVLYRERLKAGATRDAIVAEGRILKSMTTDEVETYLIAKFGSKSFDPVTDVDRPFTPDELRAFASEPYVHIGNHTHNHAILTNYSPDGMRREMTDAQNALAQMIGKAPNFVSYPNGNYSDDVIRVAQEVGFSLGVTVDRRKNYLPVTLTGDAPFRLGRFMPIASRNLIEQYSWFRSDRVLLGPLKSPKPRQLAAAPGAGRGPSRIRVLQLIEDFGLVGGAEKLVLDILTNLDRTSFEPHVAVVGPKIIPELCRSTGAKVHRIDEQGRLNWAVIRELNRIIRENKIDVIHSHLIKMNTLNGVASRWCGRPGVGSVHGVLAHETSFRSKMYAKLAGWLSARTVVVSESLGKHYIKTYHVDPDKIVTVYNGFDATRLVPPSELRLNEFRKTVGCPKGRRVICAIGNVAEVKGYRYLIEAVAHIAKTHPDIMLLIAGNDAVRDDSGKFLSQPGSAREQLGLTKLADDLGVRDRVVFLGEFREIALLLAISDLYACSSLHEGFSLTTVEAMASGLPVVVSDCGGPTEIVTNGVDGLVVPVADSGAIAAAALRILDDRDLARRMGESGKAKAYGKFSMEKFVQAHESLYRQLCLSLMSPDLYSSES
ncbi:MAG: glycosyltransferase [Candidatus Zixiibacteriota bacterium]